ADRKSGNHRRSDRLPPNIDRGCKIATRLLSLADYAHIAGHGQRTDHGRHPGKTGKTHPPAHWVFRKILPRGFQNHNLSIRSFYGWDRIALPVYGRKLSVGRSIRFFHHPAPFIPEIIKHSDEIFNPDHLIFTTCSPGSPGSDARRNNPQKRRQPARREQLRRNENDHRPAYLVQGIQNEKLGQKSGPGSDSGDCPGKGPGDRLPETRQRYMELATPDRTNDQTSSLYDVPIVDGFRLYQR